MSLLALDISNSHTTLGIFKDEELTAHWTVASDVRRTSDEWYLVLQGLVTRTTLAEVTAVAVCCTVPSIQVEIREMIDRYYAKAPVSIVGPGVKTGVPINTDNPKEVGADRIVNALAVAELYGGPAIVVDMNGTATIFDVVDETGRLPRRGDRARRRDLPRGAGPPRRPAAQRRARDAARRHRQEHRRGDPVRRRLRLRRPGRRHRPPHDRRRWALTRARLRRRHRHLSGGRRRPLRDDHRPRPVPHAHRPPPRPREEPRLSVSAAGQELPQRRPTRRNRAPMKPAANHTSSFVVVRLARRLTRALRMASARSAALLVLLAEDRAPPRRGGQHAGHRLGGQLDRDVRRRWIVVRSRGHLFGELVEVADDLHAGGGDRLGVPGADLGRALDRPRQAAAASPRRTSGCPSGAATAPLRTIRWKSSHSTSCGRMIALSARKSSASGTVRPRLDANPPSSCAASVPDGRSSSCSNVSNSSSGRCLSSTTTVTRSGPAAPAQRSTTPAWSLRSWKPLVTLAVGRVGDDRPSQSSNAIGTPALTYCCQADGRIAPGLRRVTDDVTVLADRLDEALRRLGVGLRRELVAEQHPALGVRLDLGHQLVPGLAWRDALGRPSPPAPHEPEHGVALVELRPGVQDAMAAAAPRGRRWPPSAARWCPTSGCRRGTAGLVRGAGRRRARMTPSSSARGASRLYDRRRRRSRIAFRPAPVRATAPRTLGLRTRERADRPTDDLPEQMRVRREKRQQLVERGEDPYPVTVPRTHTLKQIVGHARRRGARPGRADRRDRLGHRPGHPPAQHRQALLRPPARGRRHRAAGDALARPRRRGAAGRRSSTSSTSATTWPSPARSSPAGAASSR